MINRHQLIKPKKYILKRYPFIYKWYFFINYEAKRLIADGRLAPRDFHIVDNKKIIYLNSPKTGCSSIRAVLLAATYKHSNINTFLKSLAARKDGNVHALAMQYTQRKLSRNKKNYFKFTFVRNPFSKIVSLYEDKIELKGFNKHRELFIAYYLGGIFKPDEDFESFVSKIVRIPDFLAESHFVSQYYIIYNRFGQCLVDYIGKFETMQQDFGVIKEYFSLNDLPHLNKTTQKNWMDYYNLDTAKLVYRRYAKDINIFGYEYAYQELVDYLERKS